MVLEEPVDQEEMVGQEAALLVEMVAREEEVDGVAIVA